MAFAGTAGYTGRLISTANTGERVSRTFGTILPSVGNALAQDTTAATTAQKVDDFARALNALTTNTFADSEVTAKASVEEILSEG